MRDENFVIFGGYKPFLNPLTQKTMSIIDELIDKISAQESSLTDILIRTKVLAFQLKNEELKTWIDSELNGYNDSKTLPTYRITNCQITGTISNGFNRATNYPIPLIGLDDEMRKDMQTVKLFQSISALDMLVEQGKTGKIVMTIPAGMYGYLSKDFDNGYEIEFARREISKAQIVQVLTSVKSKLLDFLLELNIKFGEEKINDLSTGKEKDTVSSLFNSSVFGNNTTIIVGSKNSQKVAINEGLFKNFDELSKFLADNQMPSENITELQAIIDDDNPNEQNGQFGDKVKGWINKMVTKAMDGSWKIGLSAAGQVLADGIGKYYGWK